MAGRIPRDFIDDLLAKTDIVELVDSRVRLKKAGKNYQACCPFHNEKTPSFTVSQEKQFYHCFGCGAHGNAISFLIEYDRLEFPEAVEELARFHGLDVPREQSTAPSQSPQQKQQLADDYELMERAAGFYQKQIRQHADKERAISYLKGRGLSGEVVKAFSIGYAPESWDALLGAFGKSPELQQQMLDLKLITENDKRRRYDFFRDRIMFPIRDKRGRVIGFGGRVINDGTPKYLNSPETRIFHKGHELYGFYEAKQANRKLEQVLIVEGYMDVVALAQFGIHYAVASLGTSTTAEHIQMLFRATPTIICCYDGDRAGRDAAWRALENALPYLKDGVAMKFLFLPDGEDPDTMVRKVGKDVFESELNQAVPVSKFFFDNLSQRFDLGSTEGKAALKATAMPLIAQIIGDNQRDLLTQALTKITGEHDKYLAERDLQQANQMSVGKRVDFSQQLKSKVSPVRMMMRLLLDNPAIASQSPSVNPAALAQSDIAGIDLLAQFHTHCLAHPTATTPQVLEHFRSHPLSQHFAKLLSWDPHVAEDKQLKVFEDSFTRLVDKYLQSRFEALLAKSRTSGLNQVEKQELNMLIKEQKPN